MLVAVPATGNEFIIPTAAPVGIKIDITMVLMLVARDILKFQLDNRNVNQWVRRELRWTNARSRHPDFEMLLKPWFHRYLVGDVVCFMIGMGKVQEYCTAYVVLMHIPPNEYVVTVYLGTMEVAGRGNTCEEAFDDAEYFQKWVKKVMEMVYRMPDYSWATLMAQSDKEVQHFRDILWQAAGKRHDWRPGV